MWKINYRGGSSNAIMTLLQLHWRGFEPSNQTNIPVMRRRSVTITSYSHDPSKECESNIVFRENIETSIA